MTLGLPAVAAAAPFGELPFRTVPTSAVCVRATGVPGELLRWTRGGVELMRARADGLVPTGTVKLGTVSDCPQVAADATTGAAIVAASAKNAIRVAQRAPGGSWGAPATIRTGGFAQASVATSARGDALVAWLDAAGSTTRVRAALKPAGATAWAIQTLTSPAPFGVESAVSAGMSAAGEAFVVFGRDRPGRDDKALVQVATAAPGARLGAPRTLASISFGAAPALAVAPDGRALVAVGGFNDLSVYERPPGGAFGAPVSVFSGAPSTPAIALRPDGAAVLAWQQGPSDPLLSVMRTRPGPFGALQRSTIALTPRRTSFSTSFGLGAAGSVPYESQAEIRVALGADDRALVAFPTEQDGFALATLTAVGPGETQLLGSPLRDPVGLTPLTLSDGTHAVAWSDNRRQQLGGAQYPRVHYAVEGAQEAPAPAPTISVGAPNHRGLRPAQSLSLPIRCSAACDVRAWLAGGDTGSDQTVSLPAAGRGKLTFKPTFGAVAPARGRLKLTLRSGAPGARTPPTRTLRLNVRRLPNPPFPRLLNVRAQRSGGALIVRFDTDGPARDVYFSVLGTRRAGEPRTRADLVAVAATDGKGRRHFRVRLKAARRVRFVRVRMGQLVGRAHRTRTIRVG